MKDFLDVYTPHARRWLEAKRCDNIDNRPLDEKQKARDLLRAAVLERVLSQTTEREETRLKSYRLEVGYEVNPCTR